MRVLRQSEPKDVEKEKQKNVEKSSKKGIDKGKRMWYNNEAVRKSGERRESVIENWTTRDWRSTKQKSIVRKNLENSERKYNSNKSKKKLRKKLERLEHHLGDDFNTI